MTDLLPASEAAELERCEAVISRGIQTFYDVGTALTQIRDSRLYRAQHTTFEAYVTDRWGMSRPRAYELISATEVQNQLSAIADITIPNEAIARSIAKAPRDRRAEVWEEAMAVGSGRPTAKIVTDIVKRITSRAGASAGRITSHIAACGSHGNPNALSEDDPTGHRLPVATQSPPEDAPQPLSEPLGTSLDQGYALAPPRLAEEPLAPASLEAALDHAREMIANDPLYARALHWALGQELS